MYIFFSCGKVRVCSIICTTDFEPSRDDRITLSECIAYIMYTQYAKTHIAWKCSLSSLAQHQNFHQYGE